MDLQALLGVAPDYTLSWQDLVLGDGVPQDLIGVPGLYAVYVNGSLSYVGKSGNLCARLGSLIAALCGSTINAVDRGHHVAYGWDYPAEAALRFEVFRGTAAYAQERAAIRRFAPAFNRR